MLSKQEILRRFGTHKPTVSGPNPTSQYHAKLRLQFIRLAAVLEAALPDGREKDQAFTALENASMWAHKSVATQAPVDELEDLDGPKLTVEEVDLTRPSLPHEPVEDEEVDDIASTPKWVQDAESAWQSAKGTSTMI